MTLVMILVTLIMISVTLVMILGIMITDSKR